jgi:ABC-type uncharacterized transport system ATPase subunit
MLNRKRLCWVYLPSGKPSTSLPSCRCRGQFLLNQSLLVLTAESSVGKVERMNRIEALITAFGLNSAAEVLVGTPIRKGISGGQKRRLSVASQLITSPKIIFLDEPTSGLDSRASFEVMSFVKNIAAKYHVSMSAAAVTLLLTETAPGHCKHSSALNSYLHAL